MTEISPLISTAGSLRGTLMLVDKELAVNHLSDLATEDIDALNQLNTTLDTLVNQFRARNIDVFTTPDVERSALFTIEEITEAINAWEDLAGSDYLRSDERVSEAELTDLGVKLLTELGQALFMLVSTAHAMAVPDIGVALAFALAKIERRCKAKRAKLAPADVTPTNATPTNATPTDVASTNVDGLGEACTA